jgi:hypothetical protein
MKNLLNTVAVILAVIWMVCVVGFNAGGVIHVLLVLAIIALLVRMTRN